MSKLKNSFASGLLAHLFVHLTADEVSIGPVVAGVQCREPLAVTEGGGSAAHLVGVVPHHLGVVPGRSAELEWLHVLVVEELDLVVPVRHGAHPVVRRRLQRLLVDEQVLPHSKP